VSRRAALALAGALAAAAAHAHVVYGTATLRGLVLESDLVASVRIVDPGAELLLREPVVVAEPLERIKGSFPPGPLRFVQHGHGVPLYEKGQEVALFLQRIERSRELRALAGRVDWVSIEEGAALASGAERVAALRAYAALEALPAAERPAELRRVTLALLASPDARLASSALLDLALAPDVPLVGAGDLPALEKILWSAETAIGVRLGLLAELERRRLVAGPPAWARLLREARGPERGAAVRAAGAHPSAPVTQELVKLLADEDALLVAAAAVSLGAPGNDAAVAPLAQLFAAREERVRLAAVRALGRIGTPAARAALAQAAASHADPATRRRAAAEVARER
jgi:hypothetical protein